MFWSLLAQQPSSQARGSAGSNAELGLSLSNKQLCREKPGCLGLVQTQAHVNALVRSKLEQGEGSQQLQKGTPLLQAETGAPHIQNKAQ